MDSCFTNTMLLQFIVLAMMRIEPLSFEVSHCCVIIKYECESMSGYMAERLVWWEAPDTRVVSPPWILTPTMPQH